MLRILECYNRMRFLTPHSDFDYAGIVLDEFPHGFAVKPPSASEIADAAVLFKGRVF